MFVFAGRVAWGPLSHKYSYHTLTYLQTLAPAAAIPTSLSQQEIGHNSIASLDITDSRLKSCPPDPASPTPRPAAGWVPARRSPQHLSAAARVILSPLAGEFIPHTGASAPTQDQQQQLQRQQQQQQRQHQQLQRQESILRQERVTERMYSEHGRGDNNQLDLLSSFHSSSPGGVSLASPSSVSSSNIHNNVLPGGGETQMTGAGGSGQGKEPGKPNLESVSYHLLYDLTNVFIRKIDWGLYHHNIVFEDRIRGKRYEGLLEYIKFVNLLRIYAHTKFVYVRFHVLSMTKHPEDGTIRVRWRIAGMGVMRLLLRYIPDKMWLRGNLDKSAPVWYEGYSIYHVDENNKIYRHIADRVMPDDETENSVEKRVVEKLKKLKPATEPAPVL